MKTILEELWQGNICSDTMCRKPTKEIEELIECLANYHDKLQSTLTDKQKETLERFDECYAEINRINEREIFVYAFRLGARMAIEIMSFNCE